jgi:hypothetical protein
MSVSMIRVYPRTWGFCWIRNVVAGGPIRGVSLYLGIRQFAVEVR